jgi:putative oxidoreductase
MAHRQPMKHWIVENRDLVWELVRIYLGFALVIKGFAYMFHHRDLAAAMVAAGVPFASTGFAELVALTHIAGGLMMTFGIFTRLGAAIQIPNLIGAVLFVHLKEGLFTQGGSLEFALLVLFLLGIIAVVGAGRLSIDWFFSEHKESDVPHLPQPATSHAHV